MKSRSMLTLLPFVIVGCMSAETKLAGDWRIQSKSNGILSNMGAAQTGVKITFLDGHKFVFVIPERNVPRVPAVLTSAHKIEGTWSIQDKAVTFTTQSVDGKAGADFQAEEEKAIADMEAALPTIAPDPNASVTPEQQQQIDSIKNDTKSMLAKASKAMATPLPKSGSVDDSFYTLTVECENGASLEFGKKMSDN